MENIDPGLIDRAGEFLREYAKDDLAALSDSGGTSLYVEFGDVYRFDPDMADDYIEAPKTLNNTFKAGLSDVDLPVQFDTNEITIRVTDTEGFLDRQDVRDLTQQDLGRFVAIEGQLSKVTGLTYRIQSAVFECQRCTTITDPTPQPRARFQEPYECAGCERKGPFKLNVRQSSLADLRKLKLETPPGERAQGQGESVTVFAEGELPHIGGEHGLADRAGEQVVVLGRFEDNSAEITSKQAPELSGHIVAESIIFTKPTEADVTVERTQDEFKRLAAGDEGDPVDLLKRSIAPRIERTEQIDRVLEAAVAWLYNAYRVEHDGEHIRGDLHMGIIGDPGTAKSTIMSALSKIAPKCVFRSGGGGITKAGLTAAAVQEEFAGKTEWTLEPGILPRANGGHAIIDEVDEVMGEKTKAMHDALEGEQMVKVDKAGITADLPTRCAVLIGGNPKDGRFDPYAPIAEQLDMDPAFISRMDVLLDVTDSPDADLDRAIARSVLEAEAALTESQVAELLDEPLDTEAPSRRPVPIDVFRDWVHYARQHCFPKTTPESRELIEELYLDVRNLNDAYDQSDDETSIPATPRVIESAIRLSKAFARVELSETVEPRHVDRTRDILKASLKLNFDRETGQFDADKTSEALPKSQRDRIRSIRDLIDELNRDGDATREAVLETAVDDLGIDRKKVEYQLAKMKERGEIYEPPDGGVRTT